MPLPKEFLHHLHEVMVEVSDSLRDEQAEYKARVIGEAIRKNNSAAIPLAYHEAAIHAYRTRIEKTIDRYLDALRIWNLEINDSVEREMLSQIRLLLAAPKHIHFPPGITQTTNTQPYQASYGRELDRTSNEILRRAANRLREAKILLSQRSSSRVSQGEAKMTNPSSSTNTLPPAPRAFISYSWEDEEHIHWVRELATRLRADGVDVTVDQWSAVPGDQLPAFMEQAIQQNSFVVIICTPRYKSRSEKRQGGVGYEGDIITAELMATRNHRKFIPVLRKGSWIEAAPGWLSGKYHIDLSNNPYSERQYEDLARTILGLRVSAPPIGTPLATLRQSESATPAIVPATTANSTEIKIVRVIVEDVTEPRNDGTPGSGLYSVPFALSQRPPAKWADFFIENWNHPPRWTTMHRPGIARIDGATVTLNGTTIDEVERYHRDTLQLAVSEANRQYGEWAHAQERKRAEDEARRQSHNERIRDIGSRIKFD